MVSVFAYPLRQGTTLQSLRAEFLAAAAKEHEKIVVQDTRVPAPFGGYRFVRETVDEDGEDVQLLDYFIKDETNDDVHQVLMVVDHDVADEAEATLEELIAHGRWVVAAAPQR